MIICKLFSFVQLLYCHMDLQVDVSNQAVTHGLEAMLKELICNAQAFTRRGGRSEV